MEFNDPEVCAFGGQQADQMQYQVLGVHVVGQLAVHLDLDGGRDLDIEDAPERPDRSHLGGANAESERPQGSVRRGVAVGAQHDLPRPNIAVFGQYLVTDAADVATHVVKFGNPLLPHELAGPLLVGRGLGRFRRHPVIENNRDPVRVPDRGLEPGILVDRLELVDDQRRVFMRHRQVHRRLEDFTDGYRPPPGGPCEQFLYVCHAHLVSSSE